jgi:ankyrin repeat protein
LNAFIFAHFIFFFFALLLFLFFFFFPGASFDFPHAALSRLVHCGVDINAKTKDGKTAIMITVECNRITIFDSLALLGADLSIMDAEGLTILELSEGSSPELVSVLNSHGVMKGQAIPDGFISPKKDMAAPMPQQSLMNLSYGEESCIRIISLEMNQLRVEARERNGQGVCPIMFAASSNFPLQVLKRLQVAYPAGVNAQDKVGNTPLMIAVKHRNVEYVENLLEMGSCVALCDNNGFTAFDCTIVGFFIANENEARRQAIIASFKRHEVATSGATTNATDATATVVGASCATSTSPLYYQSVYFTQRVADANWDRYGTILMCMEEIDVKYRKFGDAALNDLSNEAKCFFKAFACADGTDRLGNGIARLILSFAAGDENMRAKLTGKPLLALAC